MATVVRRPPVGEFGSLAAGLLESYGFTQRTLATAVNTSPQAINNFMRGCAPQPAWVEKIATALGVTVDERAQMHVAAARVFGYQVPDWEKR